MTVITMLLQVTHQTRYHYNQPVVMAQHLLHLHPRNHLTQEVMEHSLTLDPQPDLCIQQTDAHGNPQNYLSLVSPHDRLTLTAQSVVRTHPPAVVPLSVRQTPWEAVREHFRYRVGARYDPAIEYVFPSLHVPRDMQFVDYAQPSFEPGKPLVDAARDLMRRIYTDCVYDSNSTEVHTPTLTALMQRRGVCQDFAHIFIACCRAMGLAARYVSGYLLTVPPPGMPRLIGSDASHAWASVYLPGAEGEPGHWLDCDPTNHRADWETPGQDYVLLALGRDFSDVSPVRGILHGGTTHTLEVAVTVAPL